tara:strand:+ start:231 stop:734 length:504 start_codon:yes stop_codon:yes gene_type:complete
MASLVATVTSGPKVVELAHAVRQMCEIVHSTLSLFVDDGIGITVEITGQYITHYELSARGFGRSSKAILDAVEANVGIAARRIGCQHNVSLGGDALSHEIVIDVWCDHVADDRRALQTSSRQGSFCVCGLALCYLTYATFVYYDFYSHEVTCMFEQLCALFNGQSLY